MVSFKVRTAGNPEYVRIARPLWAKLLFSNRRMYKCVATGHVALVRPEAIDFIEERRRQARASQFALRAAN
ncbi:hypothetical protein WAE61_10640 [Comamonadaceae bacterium PP-2]